MNSNHNLTESDIKSVDVKSQLEHQVQIQETKESGWVFDKIDSMKIGFHKTAELNGSIYVKIFLRSSALIIIKIDDKYCFMWSKLAKFHPCENDHPNRVSKYRQHFIELNIEGFGFMNGYKCSEVQTFEKLKGLSINIFERNFYQDHNK